MSEMVSNLNEHDTADALTAHLIGDTTPEPLPEVVDDSPCCTGDTQDEETVTTDPTGGLTPASVFLAITHNNGIDNKLPASWEASFDVWWDYTGGNLALIRTAVDAVTYVASTGANLDLLTYMDAAVLDITQWTNTGDDEPWNVHSFEARALGNLLTGLEQTDPGTYTHPLHQLVHTALTNAEEPTVTGVYGWLCRQGAMGHTGAPYTLSQLHHLAEGGTI